MGINALNEPAEEDGTAQPERRLGRRAVAAIPSTMMDDSRLPDADSLAGLRLRIAALEAAVVERDEAVRLARAGVIEVGDLWIEQFDRRVFRGGAALDLLPREYAILVCLARRAGETVGRSALEREVWGRELVRSTNAVAVHLSRLRLKLGGGTDPDHD